MQKETGTAGTLVEPTAPTEAEEADNANPGAVEDAKAAQKESKTGKYGSVPAQPFKPPLSPEQWDGKETTWIEVEMVDEDDQPVTGQLVEITVPDGRVYKSSTDHKGKVRVEGFETGDCTISFVALDEAAWEEA
ncbi:MAG: hypothetical protein R3B68_10520 [Phycisphaerales bacterium]